MFDNNDDFLSFLKKARRLSAIERCSNTPHIQRYSVAEHSYYTALLSLLFADIENSSLNIESRYDTSEVIKNALIHDLEESITGDILYPFKHGNEQLRPLLKEAIEECVDKELFIGLPENIQEYYKKLWCESKNSTKEGRLVEAMDKLEVLLFAVSEVDMGNNVLFDQIIKTAINVIKSNHKNIKSLMVVVDSIEKKYVNQP